VLTHGCLAGLDFSRVGVAVIVGRRKQALGLRVWPSPRRTPPVSEVPLNRIRRGTGLPSPVYLNREPNGVLRQLNANKEVNNQRLADILNGIVNG
jgi:hypothetical protein